MSCERDTFGTPGSQGERCCSQTRGGPPEAMAPSSAAIATAKVKKTLSFSTPARAGDGAGGTPAGTANVGLHSSVASSKSRGMDVHDTAASVGPLGGDASAAKSRPTHRTTVKVVKSRFMEPHSSAKPARAGAGAQRPDTAAKPTAPNRDRRLSMAPAPSRRQSLASGGSHDSRPATAKQAELRSKLAAFRESKSRSMAPAAAAPAVPILKPPPKGQQGTTTKQSSGWSQAAPSAGREGPLLPQECPAVRCEGSRDEYPPQQGAELGDAAAIASVLAEEAVAGNTPRAGPTLSNSLANSRDKTPTTASPKPKAYTHDELAKELAALRWQELQWAHMKARLGAALQAQESQATQSLTKAATFIASLQQHVADQRVAAQRLQVASKVQGILAKQLPELRALCKVQAQIEQAVSSTSNALQTAMLQVPLVDGAVVGSRSPGVSGTERDTATMHNLLLHCKQELEKHMSPMQQLAGGQGNLCGRATEDDRGSSRTALDDLSNIEPQRAGLPKLGAVTRDLKKTTTTEMYLASQCANLLGQIEDHSVQEHSLRVHMLQLKSTTAPEDAATQYCELATP